MKYSTSYHLVCVLKNIDEIYLFVFVLFLLVQEERTFSGLIIFSNSFDFMFTLWVMNFAILFMQLAFSWLISHMNWSLELSCVKSGKDQNIYFSIFSLFIARRSS